MGGPQSDWRYWKRANACIRHGAFKMMGVDRWQADSTKSDGGRMGRAGDYAPLGLNFGLTWPCVTSKNQIECTARQLATNRPTCWPIPSYFDPDDAPQFAGVSVVR